MTPAVCRLLFVCFFCTLWGGQVIAKDGGTKTEDVKKAALKRAQEAAGWALNNLTAAEKWADNLTTLLSQSDVKEDQVTNNASCLKEAVKNVTKAEKVLDSEEVKKVIADAETEMNAMSTEVTKVIIYAKEINTEAKEVKSKKEELKTKVEAIKTSLKAATAAANKTIEALKKVEAKQDTDSNLKGEESGPKNDDKQNGSNSQNGAQNSGTHNQQGTGDKLSTDGPHKNRSTSSSTHEGDSSGGPHGGAIATCTAAPLLLLLTAVAYAAVC